MNILPDSFEIERYGIRCRFVNVKDAEFIIKLRSDEKRSRFIHTTDLDVSKQEDWIRQYKLREQQGLEYYFIYEMDGYAFGVNRIYDIREHCCTEGSWVCLPIENQSKTIATALIMRDIVFDILNFDYDVFAVSFGNNQVKKFHLLGGAKIVEETDDEWHFKLMKEDYLNKRDWFIKTYGLK